MHCLQYSATPYCVKIYCVMYLVFSVPLLVYPNLLIVIFPSIKFFGIGIGTIRLSSMLLSCGWLPEAAAVAAVV